MSTIPLFTCDTWKSAYPDNPSTALGFCYSEKLVVLLGFLTWISVMQQVYVYIRVYKVPVSDRRLSIMAICWFSTLFTWCRYSFFSADQKGSTFFFVELFRFIIFFFVCYYFLNKASTLLPNNEQIKTGLQIFFNLSFVLSLGLSIWIYIQIVKGKNGGVQSKFLCKSWTFQLFRWDSILLAAIFGSLFCMVKRRSSAIPLETKMDRFNAAIQNNTLKRLGVAISWFLLISLFSSFTDLLSYVHAAGPGETCETGIFPKSVYFLNAIAYLILRCISSISAVWIALWLFYKPRTFSKKPKKLGRDYGDLDEDETFVNRLSGDLNDSKLSNSMDQSNATFEEDEDGSFPGKGPEEQFEAEQFVNQPYQPNFNDYQPNLADRKETLRMINNRVVSGTTKQFRIKDSEIEVDVSAQIDHGRDSYGETQLRGGVRTSSVMDEERRFRGSLESNPINDQSMDQRLDTSMNSDMYVTRNVGGNDESLDNYD